MSKFRKLAILSINVIVAAWWLNIIFGKDTNTDFLGILLIAVILFMVVFNVYAVALAKYFFKNNNIFYIELVFSILLLTPFFLLWRLSKG
jgi:hypothetical protein